MDQKTLLYVGAAAAAYYFFVHKKNEGVAAVRSDGGGIVPAAPSTVGRQQAQQVAQAQGLTQAAKNKRSVAAVIATTGARSLALGARKGVSVTAAQRQVVAQQQSSTPTKPKPKKRGFGGKLTLVGGAIVKPLAKAGTSGLNLAARNPTLTTAIAGAVGGPGAAAGTRAGLAGYKQLSAVRR